MREYIIGCDCAAVELKNTIKELLENEGIKVEDVGVKTVEDGTYYPNVAKTLCEKIQESDYEKRGILVCGTGIGMAISANKCKGIRAAVCHDQYSGERAVLSNNANAFCFGQRVIGPELAKKIVKEIISLEFKDGSSTPKVEAINALEK